MLKISNRALAAAAAALAAGGLAFGAAGTAHASVPLRAVTHVINSADDGGNGLWSIDDFTRTLTISADPALAGVPVGDTGYSATVADRGTFNAIAGAFAPNQSGSNLGVKIRSAVTGQLTGSASYTFYAPSADVPSAANVARFVNNNRTKPASGPDSTGQWYLQAFTTADQPAVGGTGIGNDWTWTYKTGCETWTDSAADNDGQSAAAGNITGRTCPPVLSHGHAVATSPVRETVYFDSSAATWVKFTITGPGPINGHQGWVPAVRGQNAGYYGGLSAHSGYTVKYVPVIGQGSSRPVRGSKPGYVYFVS